jgi:hypothetical protein
MDALRWLSTFVGGAILVLAAVPAEIWHSPAVDAAYSKFDPNVLYSAPKARITSEAATLTPTPTTAAPGSARAELNLMATPLQAFRVSFDFAVHGGEADDASFRTGVWSPWTQAGYFLTFAAKGDSIVTQTVVNGDVSLSLEDGDVTRTKALGLYRPGELYHVQIIVSRVSAITMSITGNAFHASDSIRASDLPELFTSSRVAVTCSILRKNGISKATLTNYNVILPHQRLWADKIDDVRARSALISVLTASLLLIMISAAGWLQRSARKSRSLRFDDIRHQVVARLYMRPRLVTLVLAAVLVYLIGNWMLFSLGGHPFDMGNEKLYTYVARSYGPAQLYYFPNLVSLAKLWNGVPYIESAFPYGPITAGLFTAIAWIGSLIFAGGGSFALDSKFIEYLIKSVNVVFGLADALLIYAILRQLRMNERWSLVGGALFLFNPAVWFSMSVWGQTHVFSLFFVLLAILLAERGHPMWSWLALALACLTRPQLLVFGLLLGVVLLRKFSWRQNVAALSWSVILIYLVVAPFTLATSPSLPIDIIWNNFRVQEAGANELALTTVSQDAYSIWPLITYATHGASGLQRAFTPSAQSLAGTLTYQRVSQILTVSAVLATSGAILFRRQRAGSPGDYLPLVALGITSFLMLVTGSVATHFLLALPILLLCKRWMGAAPYLYIAGIWSLTTLVPMFGDMGNSISESDYPLLAPTHNVVTRVVVDLYSSNRFITAATVANICAVVWLAVLARRRPQLSYAHKLAEC